MTIFKLMLSAILVGMVGILFLSDIEVVKLSHKPMNGKAALVNGAFWGTEWAVLGYCHETFIGAPGEGRWHAIFAITGVVTGAARTVQYFTSDRHSIYLGVYHRSVHLV